MCTGAGTHQYNSSPTSLFVSKASVSPSFVVPVTAAATVLVLHSTRHSTGAVTAAGILMLPAVRIRRLSRQTHSHEELASQQVFPQDSCSLQAGSNTDACRACFKPSQRKILTLATHPQRPASASHGHAPQMLRIQEQMLLAEQQGSHTLGALSRHKCSDDNSAVQLPSSSATFASTARKQALHALL